MKLSFLATPSKSCRLALALATWTLLLSVSLPLHADETDDEPDVAKEVVAETSHEAAPHREATNIEKETSSAQSNPTDAGAKVASSTIEDKSEQADDNKQNDSDDAKKKSDDADDDKGANDKPVETRGSIEIAGKHVDYIATAGKMTMKTDAGDPRAHVFFVAYTKENDDARNGADKPKRRDPRPITFCFNGGPGSSSVWLHLGMLGPVRVKLDSNAKALPPPHELLDNEFSLLDITDLVFIDPVSTGFSRPIKEEDRGDFHGYDEDLRSVGQFIHDYTTKYARWDSPKFLLGESYGGLRAAGLSGVLQDRYRMSLNGVVLVSAVVDFQTIAAHGRNDVAFAQFLPAYAATAWYHKALSEELQNRPVERVIRAAERFALGPYLQALAAGDSLDDERRERVVARMAELTGLSAEYVEAANLRVSMPRFGKELLRKRGRIVGRFDSRYVGAPLDPLDDTMEYDPSAAAVFGTFTSALNDYLRSTLKVEEERVYEILTDRVHPWDYGRFTNRYVEASETLRRAMTQNPSMKVFAACGHYDLATPSFAMKYTRDHLNLAPELRNNFSMGFYDAGHMMYVHEPSLTKLREDLVNFYASTLESPGESGESTEENGED